MIRAQIELAKLRGFSALRFITQHKGLGRLFKEFSPVLIEEFNDRTTYEIKVR